MYQSVPLLICTIHYLFALSCFSFAIIAPTTAPACSRNELVNILLESAIDIVKIEE